MRNIFKRRTELSLSNRKLNQIEKKNKSSLKFIEMFKENHAKGMMSFDDFSKLKHEHPYYGFVPCSAGPVDFVLFHVNDDIVAWEYLWFGSDSYERNLVSVWLEWCANPGVVYDIGAYTGLMSILAACMNNKTIVHLFEPLERTIERANINIKANNLSGRIYLHCKAASSSNRDERILLYRDENFLGTGSSIFDKGLKIYGEKKIQCVSIDDYLPDVEPTIIKIDVEGHEKDCILGMLRSIERARPKIIIELWDHTRKEILELLESMNYQCKPFEDRESRVMNFKCVPLS